MNEPLIGRGRGPAIGRGQNSPRTLYDWAPRRGNSHGPISSRDVSRLASRSPTLSRTSSPTRSSPSRSASAPPTPRSALSSSRNSPRSRSPSRSKEPVVRIADEPVIGTDQFSPKSGSSMCMPPLRLPRRSKDYNLKNVLAAQAHAVDYIHFRLRLYPIAWICHVCGRSFHQIYLRRRTRYILVKVIIVALLVSLAPHYYAMALRSELETPVARWLASPRSFWFTPVIFMIILPVLVSVVRSLSLHRRSAMRLLMFARPCLPRLFYNGLEPRGTGHFSMIDDCWLHDAFSTLDLITFCVALGLTVCLLLGVVGQILNGFTGALLGGLVGLTVSRLMFVVLNVLLGADDELMSYVETELKTFQPHRQIITEEGEINRDAIKKSMQRSVDLLELEEHAADTLEAKSKIRELSGKIHAEGETIIMAVSKWLTEAQPAQFHSLEGQCWNLFSTGCASFATTEYSIAALSFLDLPLFLMAYFDPNFEVLSVCMKWQSAHFLDRIYIANPERKLLERVESNAYIIYET